MSSNNNVIHRSSSRPTRVDGSSETESSSSSDAAAAAESDVTSESQPLLLEDAKQQLKQKHRSHDLSNDVGSTSINSDYGSLQHCELELPYGDRHVSQPAPLPPSSSSSSSDAANDADDSDVIQATAAGSTWHILLAVFASLVCPVFGVVAIALAVIARRRLASSGDSDSRRTDGAATAGQLERCSVVVSVVGIVLSCFAGIVSAVLWTLFLRTRLPPPGCPYTVGGVCYRARLNLGGPAGTACNYGRSDGGYCYYDASYPARSDKSANDAEKCDTVGADLDSLNGRCYYSSPTVCPYSANFANGICYAYRVPLPSATATTIGNCPHGYRSNASSATTPSCYYDTRLLKKRRQDCRDFGMDGDVDEYFCYGSSPLVCRHAANYVNGTCMTFAWSQSAAAAAAVCRRGAASGGYCYYAYRKESAAGWFLQRVCPIDSDLYENYCYYNK